CPSGTVELDADVTVPTTRPAAVIAEVAAACVSRKTFGTTTSEPGPVDTTRFTALPVATCVPAAGDWLITDPLGTVGLAALVTVPRTRPAPVIAVVAAAGG